MEIFALQVEGERSGVDCTVEVQLEDSYWPIFILDLFFFFWPKTNLMDLSSLEVYYWLIK